MNKRKAVQILENYAEQWDGPNYNGGDLRKYAEAVLHALDNEAEKLKGAYAEQAALEIDPELDPITAHRPSIQKELGIDASEELQDDEQF